MSKNIKKFKPGMNLVRDIRDKELAKYDWYAVRKAVENTPIPNNIVKYLQEWRDLPDSCDPKIDEAGNLIYSSVNFPVLGKTTEPEWLSKRKEEYAKINQDELRYDDLVNGTNTWCEAIEAVKTKYPKK